MTIPYEGPSWGGRLWNGTWWGNEFGRKGFYLMKDGERRSGVFGCDVGSKSRSRYLWRSSATGSCFYSSCATIVSLFIVICHRNQRMLQVFRMCKLTISTPPQENVCSEVLGFWIVMYYIKGTLVPSLFHSDLEVCDTSLVGMSHSLRPFRKPKLKSENVDTLLV